MERQERRIQMSKGARRMFSRAFGAGVDPTHLHEEAQRAIREVQFNGGERVTRVAFKGLRDEVTFLLREKIRNRMLWDLTDTPL